MTNLYFVCFKKQKRAKAYEKKDRFVIKIKLHEKIYPDLPFCPFQLPPYSGTRL